MSRAQVAPASQTLHEELLAKPAEPQSSSPLFTRIPAELRLEIFRYALTDYPDPLPQKQYAASTCYTRPSYFAPSKSDTRLLQTCRAVYQECWFMALILRESIHWLSSPDRAPPGYRQYSRVNYRTLSTIAREQALWMSRHPDTPEHSVEIDSLKVFAQMYKLEGGSLATLFRSQRLLPRAMTLTIRHTDWWFWETDEPLRFEGNWILPLSECLPATVREIHVELESVERKKNQVQEIAKQMAEKWYFKRADGALLFFDAIKESRWSGTSSWHGRTWVRDETSIGVIDYYIKTVTFRLESVIERKGGSIHPVAKKNSQNEQDATSDLKLYRPDWSAPRHSQPSISEEEAAIRTAPAINSA